MDWKNDEVVKNLIEKGKESGSLTYDELNAALPEGASDPDRLEDILELLDKNGISVIDADDAEDREEGVGGARGRVLVTDADAPTYEDSDGDGRHIDDPVRMYLTQMGEIALLDRDQEISLAKQDRSHPPPLPPQGARMRLRPPPGGRDAQARPYAATCRSTAPSRCRRPRTWRRTRSSQRMPHNLRTLEPLMEANVEDFQRLARRAHRREGAGRAPRAAPPPPPQDRHAGRGTVDPHAEGPAA